MGFFDKIKKAVLGEKTSKEVVEEKVELENLNEGTSEPALLSTEEASIPVEENVVEKIEPIVSKVEDVIEPETEEITVSKSEATHNQPVVEDKNVSDSTTVVVESSKVDASTEIESKIEQYDKGLEKSRRTFGQFMNNLFSNFRVVDDEFFEELEETLISADVGFDIAMRISDELQEEVKIRNAKKPKDVQRAIIEKLVEIYDSEGHEEKNTINIQEDGPTIILFVGVNGVGKTTSIGKLAKRYTDEGKKVLLAAADTFRAGAIDQLAVWGERANVDVVRHSAGSDPASVVYDAVAKMKTDDYDILLVDTAGRLQNKVNLMKELEKMKRIIEREYPAAPHEVLLVVDATTGQNALNQAKEFKNTTDVTGIVLTKLDGTAKGGIVLAIRNELHLPVKLVGLGEKITDLADFDPNQYVYGLFKELMENYE